jgi:hypothetical protein
MSNNEITISDEELDLALGISLSNHSSTDSRDSLAHRIDAVCAEAERLLSDLHDTIETDADHQDEEENGHYDFFTSTLRRLRSQDSSLKTLELYNLMEWDLDRFRNVDGNVEEFGLAGAIADLLAAAESSSHIQRLDFSTIRLDNPLLMTSIVDLLHCDDRIWDRLSMDECEGITPNLLLEALQGSTVKSLHLTHNQLPYTTMVSLGNILASNACCLREFRLTDFILPSCMMSVAEGLLDNSTLCTLDLAGSIWIDKQATASALAMGLRGNQGLRTLNISRCDLHDSQLEVLIMALSSHSSLLWLDLSNNSFGTKSISALTSLLIQDGGNDQSSSSKPSSITRLAGLTMTSCGVTDNDAVRLATALGHNTTLEHLHLSENCITDGGIQLFAAELRNLKTLKTLDLFQNEFNNAGAKYLLEALQTNVELNHLLVDRHIKCYDEIQYQMSLNRGGRRFLAASVDAPLALWPLVLERCQKTAFFYREKRVDRQDILFYLLHGGPVLFDNAHHPTTSGARAPRTENRSSHVY